MAARYDLQCLECGTSPVVAKGMCSRHYRRLLANGDPKISGKHRKSLHPPGTVEHLRENILIESGPLDSECWVWQKSTSKSGYGVVGTRPKTSYAHRLAYAAFVGPIGDDLFVCHKCDNPPCCNPEHLFLGTPRDNLEDMFDKGRGRRYTKLSVEGVRDIRASGTDKTTIETLAEKYNVTTAYVRDIQLGKRRKNICSL